jgi:predicted RNase H-like HicB family nuclease
MLKNFTLEYWIDENWYVGRLKGVPGVFSQGRSVKELEENIKDVYHLMIEDDELNEKKIETKEIGIEV